jgi:hypothetical protein
MVIAMVTLLVELQIEYETENVANRGHRLQVGNDNIGHQGYSKSLIFLRHIGPAQRVSGKV